MRLLHAFLLIACVSEDLSFPQAFASPVNTGGPSSFTYNRTNFLLNGMPYQIIGGQMDPQRVPPQYWRDRLKKARAMGLNTIFSYVFWNMLEPQQGNWVNTGENNIAGFFRIAEEEQLKIVLRPGPYICGERDWGGFPAWLAGVPGLVVRDYNAPFMQASRRFIERLAVDIRELQSTRGGPILMVQVENEYGSYGRDHNYTSALLDILRTTFDNGTVFYTNDGSEDWTLEGGSVPGVLAEIDGGVMGFDALERYITDPSQKGPLLDGEYYTFTADIWGPSNPHNSPGSGTIAGFVSDLDYVLGNKSVSISLYMFHGGTNFGFSNGALWQDQTRVWTSSYDYGAPLDESGRITDSYNAIRQTIQKYVEVGSIPDVPLNLPMMEVPEFKLQPVIQLFETLGKNTLAEFPMSMEALGQDYGFTLYENIITWPVSGSIQPGGHARDRVIIYVNGNRIGIIDSEYKNPPAVNVSLGIGDKLQLFVENLGRVNYYSRGTPYQNRVTDPYKGIVGNVTIGGIVLQDWSMFTLPLADISFVDNIVGDAVEAANTSQNTPVFYRGCFNVTKEFSDLMELDTYLAIPAGVKGNVWVNGFNLGRYWRVGPQQSLYLPGTLLKPGDENQVVVLELEPDRVKGEMVGKGLAQREWGNNLDEDCLTCT
ncbi:hypothetical protein HYALB_00005545 [Hymenoscyphus albidus]|uniref:Beta-galactosidase n=1 Tax=Hymenoscyphus albidus TaxID=595503 RepID=A0A9N9M3C4_9HELO|nr:hypothetical protein HYALB_00005545 [Hymenoscyphus albidus]